MNPTATEVDFLRSEIDTGLTLCRIASETANADKIERNRSNARKAYESVLRFLPRVPLANDEHQEITSKLRKLRKRLQALGEGL